MPRQARLDTPGTLHHVICRGIEKREIVSDDHDRDTFIARLGKTALETDTGIYAWALMNNHAHILLRSGTKGISHCMSKLLTGYAIYYNHRHKRHGYLFQNRYKSIVCEEEPYFLELVRYIHLNPARAAIVKTIEELDAYPYCGHSTLMGEAVRTWQDRDFVLSQFDEREGKAKRRYREFVAAGIEQGNRPELVGGGGLVRSIGGWSQVMSMRQRGTSEAADRRILGSAKFVEKVLEDEENKVKPLLAQTRDKLIKDVINACCSKSNISIHELKGGSRRQQVSAARREIAHVLVKGHGVPMATVALEVGVTTAAISRIMRSEVE